MGHHATRALDRVSTVRAADARHSAVKTHLLHSEPLPGFQGSAGRMRSYPVMHPWQCRD